VAGDQVTSLVEEERDWEGVDCQLLLVEGEAKGQQGRVSNGKGVVELGGEGLEVGCEGSGGGGRVRDEESHRSSVIDLCRDGKGESAVGIPKEASGDLREGGSDKESLRVFSGGGAWRVEPPFSRG